MSGEARKVVGPKRLRVEALLKSAEPLSVTEIANRAGCSSEYVRLVAQIVGARVSRRPYARVPVERRALLRGLWEAGYTLQRIARWADVSLATVRRICGGAA